MHFKMSSAICFNLDQSNILSSGNALSLREFFKKQMLDIYFKRERHAVRKEWNYGTLSISIFHNMKFFHWLLSYIAVVEAIFSGERENESVPITIICSPKAIGRARTEPATSGSQVLHNILRNLNNELSMIEWIIRFFHSICCFCRVVFKQA